MAKEEKDREVTFELMEHIGVFGKDPKGWTREVNKVSWNNGPVKYDIRNWDEEHKRMSKGITLTELELVALRDLIQELDI